MGPLHFKRCWYNVSWFSLARRSSRSRNSPSMFCDVVFGAPVGSRSLNPEMDRCSCGSAGVKQESKCSVAGENISQVVEQQRMCFFPISEKIHFQIFRMAYLDVMSQRRFSTTGLISLAHNHTFSSPPGAWNHSGCLKVGQRLSWQKMPPKHIVMRSMSVCAIRALLIPICGELVKCSYFLQFSESLPKNKKTKTNEIFLCSMVVPKQKFPNLTSYVFRKCQKKKSLQTKSKNKK